MRYKTINYNPKLKERARELRKNMTFAEKLLWIGLKSKKLRGYDFDRQKPIGSYIIDFYCKELQLAIEVDGGSHEGKFEYDEERTTKLELLGVKVLRFTDKEVRSNVEGVLALIEDFIRAQTHPDLLRKSAPPKRGN